MEFKNVTGDTLEIPSLGVRVKPGDTFEVTGDAAKGLNPSWFERTDKRKTNNTEES